MPILSDDKPIYLQIKEYLEGEILIGSLKDDDQIPSTNELAAFFSINPITVLKGVTMLSDEDIIYKKRGIGMFVSDGACKKIQERYRNVFMTERVKPLVQKAKSLQFTQKELEAFIQEAWNTPSNRESTQREKEESND